jgi:uncharacterized protein YegP (UPF0339 family)/DNA-binding transcriptional regulator YiaG
VRKRAQADPKENLRELNKLYADLDAGAIGLPEAIRGMRKISRLTQQEFAKHRGISVQALKQLEQGKGNPTVETLNKLASVFGLEVGLRPRRHSSPPRVTMPSFTLERSEGHFHFTLRAANGLVLLSSERYTSRAAALQGVETVRRSSVAKDGFVQKRSADGSLYFCLRATNGETVGTSSMFASQSALDRAMDAVREIASDAELLGSGSAP